MPELPEVETVRRGLEPAVTGKTITRVELHRPDLRFPFPVDFVARLEGRKVLGLRRRSKYILFDMSSAETLILHLGMSGRVTISTPDEHDDLEAFYQAKGISAKHEHVVFHLNDQMRISYFDPRRFGLMDLCKTDMASEHRLLKDIGIEPTGNRLSGAFLKERFQGKRTSAKAALLDQKIVAGLGNIYVCEALFRAGISPKKPIGGISQKRLNALATAMREVIREAIEKGGSSLKDFAQTDGTLGYFQTTFMVYDQEGMGCPKQDCPGRIKRIVQNGRSTFYCPRCQR